MFSTTNKFIIVRLTRSQLTKSNGNFTAKRPITANMEKDILKGVPNAIQDPEVLMLRIEQKLIRRPEGKVKPKLTGLAQPHVESDYLVDVDLSDLGLSNAANRIHNYTVANTLQCPEDLMSALCTLLAYPLTVSNLDYKEDQIQMYFGSKVMTVAKSLCRESSPTAEEIKMMAGLDRSLVCNNSADWVNSIKNISINPRRVNVSICAMASYSIVAIGDSVTTTVHGPGSSRTRTNPNPAVLSAVNEISNSFNGNSAHAKSKLMRELQEAMKKSDWNTSTTKDGTDDDSSSEIDSEDGELDYFSDTETGASDDEVDKFDPEFYDESLEAEFEQSEENSDVSGRDLEVEASLKPYGQEFDMGKSMARAQRIVRYAMVSKASVSDLDKAMIEAYKSIKPEVTIKGQNPPAHIGLAKFGNYLPMPTKSSMLPGTYRAAHTILSNSTCAQFVPTVGVMSPHGCNSRSSYICGYLICYTNCEPIKVASCTTIESHVWRPPMGSTVVAMSIASPKFRGVLPKFEIKNDKKEYFSSCPMEQLAKDKDSYDLMFKSEWKPLTGYTEDDWNRSYVQQSDCVGRDQVSYMEAVEDPFRKFRGCLTNMVEKVMTVDNPMVVSLLPYVVDCSAVTPLSIGEYIDVTDIYFNSGFAPSFGVTTKSCTTESVMMMSEARKGHHSTYSKMLTFGFMAKSNPTIRVRKQNPGEPEKLVYNPITGSMMRFDRMITDDTKLEDDLRLKCIEAITGVCKEAVHTDDSSVEFYEYTPMGVKRVSETLMHRVLQVPFLDKEVRYTHQTADAKVTTVGDRPRTVDCEIKTCWRRSDEEVIDMNRDKYPGQVLIASSAHYSSHKQDFTISYSGISIKMVCIRRESTKDSCVYRYEFEIRDIESDDFGDDIIDVDGNSIGNDPDVADVLLRVVGMYLTYSKEPTEGHFFVSAFARGVSRKSLDSGVRSLREPMPLLEARTELSSTLKSYRDTGSCNTSRIHLLEGILGERLSASQLAIVSKVRCCYVAARQIHQSTDNDHSDPLNSAQSVFVNMVHQMSGRKPVIRNGSPFVVVYDGSDESVIVVTVIACFFMSGLCDPEVSGNRVSVDFKSVWFGERVIGFSGVDVHNNDNTINIEGKSDHLGEIQVSLEARMFRDKLSSYGKSVFESAAKSDNSHGYRVVSCTPDQVRVLPGVSVMMPSEKVASRSVAALAGSFDYTSSVVRGTVEKGMAKDYVTSHRSLEVLIANQHRLFCRAYMHMYLDGQLNLDFDVSLCTKYALGWVCTNMPHQVAKFFYSGQTGNNRGFDLGLDVLKVGRNLTNTINKSDLPQVAKSYLNNCIFSMGKVSKNAYISWPSFVACLIYNDPKLASLSDPSVERCNEDNMLRRMYNYINRNRLCGDVYSREIALFSTSQSSRSSTMVEGSAKGSAIKSNMMRFARLKNLTDYIKIILPSNRTNVGEPFWGRMPVNIRAIVDSTAEKVSLRLKDQEHPVEATAPKVHGNLPQTVSQFNACVGMWETVCNFATGTKLTDGKSVAEYQRCLAKVLTNSVASSSGPVSGLVYCSKGALVTQATGTSGVSYSLLSFRDREETYNLLKMESPSLKGTPLSGHIVICMEDLTWSKSLVESTKDNDQKEQVLIVSPLCSASAASVDSLITLSAKTRGALAANEKSCKLLGHKIFRFYISMCNWNRSNVAHMDNFYNFSKLWSSTISMWVDDFKECVEDPKLRGNSAGAIASAVLCSIVNSLSLSGTIELLKTQPDLDKVETVWGTFTASDMCQLATFLQSVGSSYVDNGVLASLAAKKTHKEFRHHTLSDYGLAYSLSPVDSPSESLYGLWRQATAMAVPHLCYLPTRSSTLDCLGANQYEFDELEIRGFVDRFMKTDSDLFRNRGSPATYGGRKGAEIHAQIDLEKKLSTHLVEYMKVAKRDVAEHWSKGLSKLLTIESLSGGLLGNMDMLPENLPKYKPELGGVVPISQTSTMAKILTLFGEDVGKVRRTAWDLYNVTPRFSNVSYVHSHRTTKSALSFAGASAVVANKKAQKNSSRGVYSQTILGAILYRYDDIVKLMCSVVPGKLKADIAMHGDDKMESILTPIRAAKEFSQQGDRSPLCQLAPFTNHSYPKGHGSNRPCPNPRPLVNNRPTRLLNYASKVCLLMDTIVGYNTLNTAIITQRNDASAYSGGDVRHCSLPYFRGVGRFACLSTAPRDMLISPHLLKACPTILGMNPSGSLPINMAGGVQMLGKLPQMWPQGTQSTPTSSFHTCALSISNILCHPGMRILGGHQSDDGNILYALTREGLETRLNMYEYIQDKLRCMPKFGSHVSCLANTMCKECPNMMMDSKTLLGAVPSKKKSGQGGPVQEVVFNMVILSNSTSGYTHKVVDSNTAPKAALFNGIKMEDRATFYQASMDILASLLGAGFRHDQLYEQLDVMRSIAESVSDSFLPLYEDDVYKQLGLGEPVKDAGLYGGHPGLYTSCPIISLGEDGFASTVITPMLHTLMACESFRSRVGSVRDACQKMKMSDVDLAYLAVSPLMSLQIESVSNLYDAVLKAGTEKYACAMHMPKILYMSVVIASSAILENSDTKFRMCPPLDAVKLSCLNAALCESVGTAREISKALKEREVPRSVRVAIEKAYGLKGKIPTRMHSSKATVSTAEDGFVKNMAGARSRNFTLTSTVLTKLRIYTTGGQGAVCPLRVFATELTGEMLDRCSVMVSLLNTRTSLGSHPVEVPASTKIEKPQSEYMSMGDLIGNGSLVMDPKELFEKWACPAQNSSLSQLRTWEIKPNIANASQYYTAGLNWIAAGSPYLCVKMLPEGGVVKGCVRLSIANYPSGEVVEFDATCGSYPSIKMVDRSILPKYGPAKFSLPVLAIDGNHQITNSDVAVAGLSNGVFANPCTRDAVVTGMGLVLSGVLSEDGVKKFKPSQPELGPGCGPCSRPDLNRGSCPQTYANPMEVSLSSKVPVTIAVLPPMGRAGVPAQVATMVSEVVDQAIDDEVEVTLITGEYCDALTSSSPVVVISESDPNYVVPTKSHTDRMSTKAIVRGLKRDKNFIMQHDGRLSDTIPMPSIGSLPMSRLPWRDASTEGKRSKLIQEALDVYTMSGGLGDTSKLRVVETHVYGVKSWSEHNGVERSKISGTEEYRFMYFN